MTDSEPESSGRPARLARPSRGGAPGAARVWQVLWTALRLGCSSFGGPVAHLGYFERAYVRRRQWVSSEQYGGLVGLCQLLPGPASSQVGFLIGLHRAGWFGAIAAWVGFTLPSAALMFVCARLSMHVQAPWLRAGLHGLKLLAVAVVAQAVWSMQRRLCPDRTTAGLAIGAAVILLATGGAMTQLLVLALGAAGGVILCRASPPAVATPGITVRPAIAWAALAAFTLLLAALPLVARHSASRWSALAAIFYRGGALVFGGGHVVLPLLRASLVPGGWISDDRFLAGYGLAQLLPGPLFAIGAYLGASTAAPVSPILGAAVGLFGLFLPGLLIAVAGVSLWTRFARHPRARAALTGINAAVVGILGAALYDPVWVTAVHGTADAALAIAGVLLLERWKMAPIAVAALCVGASEAAALLH